MRVIGSYRPINQPPRRCPLCGRCPIFCLCVMLICTLIDLFEPIVQWLDEAEFFWEIMSWGNDE